MHYTQKTGFTLLELIVVVIIIGILATLGTINYGNVKERTLDKDAQTNLKLIRAAERIYRMETGEYVACATNQELNTNLKLAVPNSTDAGRRPEWDYSVTANNDPNTPTFESHATRTKGPRQGQYWCIKDDTTKDPVTIGVCP